MMKLIISSWCRKIIGGRRGNNNRAINEENVTQYVYMKLLIGGNIWKEGVIKLILTTVYLLSNGTYVPRSYY